MRAESARWRACTCALWMVPNAALVFAPLLKFKVSELFGLLGLKWLSVLKDSTAVPGSLSL